MESEGKLSYVKKVIHSLVVSSPQRMTIETLMRDYRSEEGCNVPYSTLGFRDMESLLRSIPDTVLVMGHGPTANVLAVTTANSAHIQNLVQCQKKPSKRSGKIKAKFFYRSEQSDLKFINERIRNMQHQQQWQQQHQQQQQRQYQQPVHHVPISYPNYSRLYRPPVVYPNINALMCAGQQQQVPYFNPPMLWPNQTFGMLNPFPYPYPQNVPMYPKIAPNPPRQNLTRPEVLIVRNPQPHAVVQASLPEKPQIEIKEMVDSFKKLSTENTAPTGFVDPLDNEPYVSDGDKWTRDDFSSEDEILSSSATREEKPDLVSPIAEAIEVELEPISQSELNPESLSKPATPESIDQSRGRNNPFIESSDEEETDPHPVTAYLKLQESLRRYESSDDGSDESAIPAYAVDDRVLSVDYPKDCIRSDFKLPVRNASDIFEVGQRIEVQLVRVEHPHSFNFWIYNEEYEDYKAMYLSMQVCYESQFPDKYTMPLCLITTDHICAVRSSKNNAWERAQVVRHQPGNSSKIIEVQLVDTGEVMCVSHKDVRHLLKEFATLPPQCLNGRLAFITPWKGPGWSAEAVKYFFRLVSFRRLYAKIEGVKNNFAYLVLVDPETVAPLNKNLNRALIESGWVRRCYTN
ncbi:LOW QUALITY PROTEIN: uncharacterized protein LOC110189215 [Drosophila serrata]|uniref:LOW QUALITY PROTEIN: uncharacterized protein LOC110189215 n=1 Tax=Drosophila serrata TaxID=7274 RepID=UPI000A1D2642|nr:LOW QUALITY PROTEIN: uncharacterized protein LOC110189215 [Drosophila serrata]